MGLFSAVPGCTSLSCKSFFFWKDYLYSPNFVFISYKCIFILLCQSLFCFRAISGIVLGLGWNAGSFYEHRFAVLQYDLGFNDASLPSHRWTDYWPPSEIIVSDYWSSQKTSQINRFRWFRKIIATIVMFTLKTLKNLHNPSKPPQSLQNS